MCAKLNQNKFNSLDSMYCVQHVQKVISSYLEKQFGDMHTKFDEDQQHHNVVQPVKNISHIFKEDKMYL